MNKRIKIRGVYYLESKNQYMNPIGIRVEISPDYIAWEDTGHGRVLRTSKVLLDGKEIDSKTPSEIDQDHMPNTIEITSEKGEIYQFVKLTVKIFNDILKKQVAGGDSLNFNDDRELQEYYLKADFYTAG